MDVLTRYFLRRLAIAHRKKKYSTKAGFHRDALVEVILVVLAAPAIAVFSFVFLATLKWSNPLITAKWPYFSVKNAALVIWVFTLIAGNKWLGRKFKEYLDDPRPYLDFDSDRDRRVVFWQKFIVLVVCGLVFPWLGIAVLYLSQ